MKTTKWKPITETPLVDTFYLCRNENGDLTKGLYKYGEWHMKNETFIITEYTNISN